LKRSPGSTPRGLLSVSSQLRKRRQKAKNLDLDLSVRMTDAKPCRCISCYRKSLAAQAFWPHLARRTHRTASCHLPIAEAIDTNDTNTDVEAT